MKRAAFFDLDRTLLGDSSAIVIMEALNERGLVSDRDQSLAQLGRRFFRLVGETRVGMELTRRSLARMAGWSRQDLKDAAVRSIEKLDAAVYSEARTLIERHHAEGHLVCIATSTGRDYVEPLAAHLGVDQLIATEYEEDEHGVYTGNLIGKWLWGPDKAEAVKAFAEREDIDLSESYAYSDSYYDRPLLESVGYPRVVNPDLLLRGYAARKGWPVLGFNNRDGLPKMALEPYDALLPLAHPLVSAVHLVVEGVQLIPREGPVILAANHVSYLDPIVLAMVASRRGRKLRFLAKKEMFEAPVVGQAMRALGQIRVDRGSGSSTPLEVAVDALARGEAIGIFPEGTIPKDGQSLKARTGVVRLAMESEAPIVPVGIWGTDHVWPRSDRFPRPMELLMRRPVHAKVGEPFTVKKGSGGMQDLADSVLERIREQLPG